MKQLRYGTYARRLAGHDKGRLYIIIEETDGAVSLCDGRLRKVDNPKKKKKKHVLVEYNVSPVIEERIEAGRPVRDEDIRKALKEKEKHKGQEEEIIHVQE